MSTHLALDRGKAVIAALLAFLLVLAGAAITPAAQAADGPSVSAGAVPRAGGTVTVTGSGFSGVSPGVYLAVGPAGLPGFYAGSSQLGDTVWIAPGNESGGEGAARTAPMGADGTFSVQMSVPAFADGRQYSIYTSKAHGQGFSDPSQNTTTALAWEPLPAVATTTTLMVDPAGSSRAGETFTLGATVEPAASGSVSYFRGDAKVGEAAVGSTVTTSVADAGTVSLSAVFTPADPAAFVGSTSAAVSYEITAASTPSPTPTPTTTAGVPTVTVSKTAGLDAAGETVTVTGTGFVPNPPATSGTRPPLQGKFTGSYVVFGKFLDEWKPSTGAPSSARTSIAQKWGVLEADLATIGGSAAGGIVIGADGSFQTELTVSASEVNDLLAGNYGIYTYPGGGAKYAPFETYTPITFAEPAPVPTVTGSVTDVSKAAGATVKTVATNLGPITGAYAAIIEKGTEADVTASSGFVAMSYVMGITGGAFEKNLIAATANLDRTKQYEVIVWKQHTMPDSLTIYTRSDIAFTPAQWDVLFPPTEPEVPATPEVPVVTPTVPGGSLRWAISSSFTSYVTGSIAHGSVSVSGGATRSGGLFQFGQATGSTYSAASGTGTVSYVGAARFTGHNGILDVTIANPQLRITSPTAATLYVTSGGAQVAFATVNLGAAARTESNGAVTFAGAPASLTAAGQNQVLGGFSTSLDPLTFTVGTASAAPSGSTGTVATTAAAAKPTARALPTTPPATAGIEVDDATLTALQAGESATVSASGFAPNEADIAVVVYSTPVLLGTVTADASGTATWTGSLPATLEDGDHTLTFQGASVSRGLTFSLQRAASALGACTTQGAELAWGFKESFRTYIEGIAAGGWELTDVAYEYPSYVWANGTGSLDVDDHTGLVTYGGAIRFTGHAGALDTTLSDFRLELAGDTGYIVVDVAGTTQTGEPISAAGVRLAEFAVPDLEITDGALVLDALPATLTEAGAAAFGTYPAGEAMDPVSAVIPVDGCEVTAAAAENEKPVAAEQTAVVEDEASAPVWPWIVGGGVLLLIGAAAWIIVARRRASAHSASETPVE
ncbi:hypothetical protein ASD65_12095 [Microbacterium sp. Root61]|uniref:HtaA domain-containing protein n=1 Tax=Microbacterium sp. Root61 TaxID=1736570 RepID=UPI0006F60E8A|nr:HtaA domain-containing protein [Microbacterium sp. Root61]KRA25080.1 hypothetical protein ASD65_12095 [Microbacterium sp. Root61]